MLKYNTYSAFPACRVVLRINFNQWELWSATSDTLMAARWEQQQKNGLDSEVRTCRFLWLRCLCSRLNTHGIGGALDSCRQLFVLFFYSPRDGREEAPHGSAAPATQVVSNGTPAPLAFINLTSPPHRNRAVLGTLLSSKPL